KALITRKVDGARMAYDRYTSDHPRRFTFIATKNPGGFLNDPTGERRWWPIEVKGYDREAFLRDKDQLYAEAVSLENRAPEEKEKLWLDAPELKEAHAAIVAKNKEPDLLVDALADLKGEVFEVNKTYEERISNAQIRGCLNITKMDALKMPGA